MSNNKGIVFGIVALVLIVGGIYFASSNKKDAISKDKIEDDLVMKSGDSKIIEKDEIKDKELMMQSGSYEVYSPEKINLASSTHHVVLFFRASWCPTCIGLDNDIRSNMSKIPKDLTILDVNYDNSIDLKKKYGVTYQHTFVQVDKDGSLIKKWSGSPTLSNLVTEIK